MSTIGDIYINGEYFEKNPTWGVEDATWKATQIMKMVHKHGLTPQHVIDVGCGAGEIVVQLSKQLGEKVQFSGYEISPQAFEICQPRATHNIQFFHTDVTSLDVQADLIIAMDVFEHIEDYYGFLRQLREKGEYKIFHIPLDLFVWSMLRSKLLQNKRDTVGHLHYFTRETALASLQEVGYTIVDSFYTESGFKAATSQFSWLNLARKMLYGVSKDFGAKILGGCSLLVLAK